MEPLVAHPALPPHLLLRLRQRRRRAVLRRGRDLREDGRHDRPLLGVGGLQQPRTVNTAGHVCDTGLYRHL